VIYWHIFFLDNPEKLSSHFNSRFMAININKYTAEANRFVNEVAAELGDTSDLEAAGRVTIAVFHTLREKLSVEESFHLLAQLPTILKGVYIDGWDPTKITSNTDSVQDFIDELRAHDIRAAARDFGDEEQAVRNFQSVIRVLSHYVSEGEMRHIRQQLPRPVAELFETW
jgi:uncharacterized protein (DUF2267 family)